MPNPPSTQSVCPTCGSTDPELHPGIGVMGIADPCSDDFHSPDTQTEERGGSMDAHSRGVLAGDDICSGCGYAYSACICPPPDPQGQVDTSTRFNCERCHASCISMNATREGPLCWDCEIADIRSQLDQAERRAEEAEARLRDG